MRYFLAIDIGASSGRHILGSLDCGKIVTEEIYRFPSVSATSGGHLVWDAEKLFKEVLAGLKRAGETGKIPEFVGIDTWAVDYALLDARGGRVADVYAYRDGRTESVIPAVHERVGFGELYSRTGIQFQPFNTIYQLAASQAAGDLQSASSFLMLPDYLDFLLTGVKKQEYTNATSTGLVNAQTREWDYEIIDRLGFKRELFGELSQPQTTVGKFKDEIAREVGYSATVVLPATHDTASAVIAAPIAEQTPYISSGTWSLLGVEQPRAHTDERSRAVNYSNEGSVNGGFRYQKNVMGLWIIQSIKRELGDKYSFAELQSLAENAKGGALIDVNDGRFLNPKNMCEEIDCAVGRSLSVAERVRTVYDSLAKSYSEAIAELEENTGKSYGAINIFGGGCRDGFLNRLTAKTANKRVITGPVEATAIGNLVMQMIAAGEIDGVRSAREIIKNSFEIKEII